MPVALIGNNWGGRSQQTLIDYVVAQAETCDLMAFTEVNHLPGTDGTVPLYMTNPRDKASGLHDQIMLNQFEVLSQELYWTHAPYFTAENCHTYMCASGAKYPQTQYGNALFTHCSIDVIETGSIFILGEFNGTLENGSSPRVLQYVVFRMNGQWYLFAHFHGVWYKCPRTGNTKSDGPLRVTQSANVLTTLEKIAAKYAVEKVVFGGDFNLDIDTHALRMFEQGSAAGLMKFRNLIKEFGITNTRTPLYREWGNPDASMFADYVFVSKAVQVHELTRVGFKTSDHVHLQLDFS